MEESKRNTEKGHSEQEKDSGQPRQNEGLLLSHGCSLDMKSLTRSKQLQRTLQIMLQTGSHNRLKQH